MERKLETGRKLTDAEYSVLKQLNRGNQDYNHTIKSKEYKSVEVPNHQRQRQEQRVLVLVKDERTVEQLMSYLAIGAKSMLGSKFLNYIVNKNTKDRQRAQLLQKQRSSASSSRYSGKKNKSKSPRGYQLGKKLAQLEDDIAAGKKDNETVRLYEEDSGDEYGNFHLNNEQHRTKREIASQLESELLMEQELHMVECLQRDQSLPKFDPFPTASTASNANSTLREENEYSKQQHRKRIYKRDDENSNKDDHKNENDNEMEVCFYTHAQVWSSLSLLYDLSPTHLILYDPDVQFVREIEMYHSSRRLSEKQMKVYFMLYEESVEDQRYTKAIKREQECFERLIMIKSRLNVGRNLIDEAVEEMENARAKLDVISKIDSRSSSRNSSSFLRNRSKQNISKKQMENLSKVVVDVREFRSMLPKLLYQSHFILLPYTLEIGDYVITPEICIERKSIMDLIGSFSSGRLFNQIEAMRRYYKVPALLIEFDAEKTFCLLPKINSSSSASITSQGDRAGHFLTGDREANTAQNVNTLKQASNNNNNKNHSASGGKSTIKSIVPNEITLSALTSKLVLLTIHYPELRIIWSRSAFATCDIFRALKRENAPVNVDKAINVGTEEWKKEIENIEGNEYEHNDKNDKEGSNNNRERGTTEKLKGAAASYTDAIQKVRKEERERIQQRSEDSVGRNILAYDILLKLPGIYNHNIFNLMHTCDTLVEVSNLSEKEMRELLGNVNGKKLYTFFNTNASL